MPPPTVRQFEYVGAIIKGIAAIYALFPGIAILYGLVEIPPTLVDMVKIIAFSVSGIVLLSVFLLDSQIRRLRPARAVVYSVIGVLLGAVCVVTFFSFANQHAIVVENSRGEEQHFITPLTPSQEIIRIVHPRVPNAPTPHEYKRAMQIEPEREHLKELVRRASLWTTVIIIVLLVLSEVLLIAPLVAAAWRLAYALFGQAGAVAGPIDQKPDSGG